MGTNKHIQPAFTMNASAIIESTRGLVAFYEPLSALIKEKAFWNRIEYYCLNLEQYPVVMSALSRLHANSMIDFERGLFCGLMSVLVGDRLGVAPERIKALYYAGLSQDVGSYMDDFRVAEHFSGPRDLISNKIMGITGAGNNSRSHALVSYSLLEEAIPDDVLVAELVLHHHASEDGTGYPSNVGESQLSEEMQILIVANQLCDILYERGGYDELFSCRAELKLASTMFFKRVNGAYYDVIQESACALDPIESMPVNQERLKVQVQALGDFASKAVLLNGQLMEFEHYNPVRLLRSRIRKIDLMMNESGLLFTLDDGCLAEAAQCMEALPEFLGPMLELVKETHRVLPRDYRGDAGELKVSLKNLISVLRKPKPFSLFV